MACLSGTLLWACYFPLAWGWVLGWVALVPLLTLVRSEAKPSTIYRCAWIGGVCFFAPALWWMIVADPRMAILWALLFVYCALYVAVGVALVRWLDRSWPLVVSVPVVWIALEYLRCWLMTGFSWYLLGHTLQAALPFIQVADVGGVFAVSLLIAAVNAILCDALCQVPAVRARLRLREPERLDRCIGLWEVPIRRGLFFEAAAVAVLIGFTFAYGQYRLGQDRFAPGPTIALLQGNLDQRLRNEAAAEQADPVAADDEQLPPRQKIARHFTRLCERALGFPKPDLIVWPETSYPSEWIEVAPQLPIEQVPTAWRDAEIEFRDHLQKLAHACPTYQLLGMNSNILDGNGAHSRYNSALLLSAQGRVEARFDKMHRLPFGEYIPLRDWLPFMNRLSPYDFEYSIQPGEKFTRFELGPYRFGVLICYEDSDPFLATHYAVAAPDGPPVDFLINMSNDGWYGGSAEHEEHLAVSRFRAIECRRPLARAVNMGISALIDGNGRVLEPTPAAGKGEALWIVAGEVNKATPELPVSAWSRFKKTPGVLKAVVPLDGRSSVYARFGDVLPRACWVLLLATAGATWLRRRLARRVSLPGPRVRD